MVFIVKYSKKHNSVKMNVELKFLPSTHYLMMLYICTKFRGNKLKGFRTTERTRFPQ